jgi:hypothetical protein
MKLTIELIKEWYAEGSGYKPNIILTEDYTDTWDAAGLRRTFGSCSAEDCKILSEHFDRNYKTRGYGDCETIDAESWKPWCEGQQIDVFDVQDNDGDGVKCLLEAEDGSYVWCYVQNYEEGFEDVQEIIDSITIEE